MTPTLDSPRRLRSAPIETLQAAAAAVEQWTEQDARMLDQVLRGHVIEALLGSSDPEALTQLYRAVLRVVPRRHRTTLQHLDRNWIERWEGWADLLDGRIAQLRNQASTASDVELIKHVPEILACVTRHPGLSQAEIGDRLGLTAPNVTRLLRILEDHQRVERRRVGNAKHVYPSTLRAMPGGDLQAVLRQNGSEDFQRAQAGVAGEVDAA